jgi:hypothetical protein
MWWFLYGLILGAGIMNLVSWAIHENRQVSWYAWLIGSVALLLITMSLQHFYASRKEMEYKAAWMGLLLLGIPALILIGITSWLFIWS